MVRRACPGVVGQHVANLAGIGILLATAWLGTVPPLAAVSTDDLLCGAKCRAKKTDAYRAHRCQSLRQPMPNLARAYTKKGSPFGEPFWTAQQSGFCLVGAIGLEPTTPTMSRWCSNQLSYVPAVGSHSIDLRRGVNTFFAAKPMNSRIIYLSRKNTRRRVVGEGISTQVASTSLVKNIKQRLQNVEHVLSPVLLCSFG